MWPIGLQFDTVALDSVSLVKHLLGSPLAGHDLEGGGCWYRGHEHTKPLWAGSEWWRDVTQLHDVIVERGGPIECDHWAMSTDCASEARA